MMIGWANYFCLGPVGKTYEAVDRHAKKRLRHWLCTKHKVRWTGAKSLFITRLVGMISALAIDPGWITSNSDRTAATLSQILIGGTEAIDHEAETLLTKKTHQHKICPAPARPRARQSRSLE
jgi:hypothetical protein